MDLHELVGVGDGRIPCFVCGEANDRRFVARQFGVDVCEPCETGQAAERAAAWGLELEFAQGRAASQNRDQVTAFEARGLDFPDLGVRFSKQGLMERFAKLGTTEPEAGDAIFDDRVYVLARDKALAAELITDERLQSAVIYLVGEDFLVGIEDGKLYARRERTLPLGDPTRFVLPLVVLAKVLARPLPSAP